MRASPTINLISRHISCPTGFPLSITKEASINALKARPLAIQLSFTRNEDGDVSLSLLIAEGAATALNSGACTIDQEDHHFLGHLLTSKTYGSLIRIQPYHDTWDVYLDAFFSKFIAEFTRSEQTLGDYVDAYEI